MNLISATFDPARRGFHFVYRDGEANHCPGCGRTQWLVGRVSAECAFCSTALPLEASMTEHPSANFRCSGGGVPDPWPKPSLETPRVVRRGKQR